MSAGDSSTYIWDVVRNNKEYQDPHLRIYKSFACLIELELLIVKAGLVLRHSFDGNILLRRR